MKFTRKDFMSSAAAFAVSPMLAADGRKIRTPLMLDTKRMAIHDGPGSGTRTTATQAESRSSCRSGRMVSGERIRNPSLNQQKAMASA